MKTENVNNIKRTSRWFSIITPSFIRTNRSTHRLPANNHLSATKTTTLCQNAGTIARTKHIHAPQ